ncbi:ABC transporter permease [Streptomyces europaeiscabiei]|uniref:ABC transporter permease n=1 Tax=Streptomyces europaeiscabiei TaxID=146819 RepID=UPI002E1648DE|nr:ABC transporter permease [Streptomyces europaeiscabiei]WSG28386.1 ABC transporter permease [Streptomyces europaeiscabiei]
MSALVPARPGPRPRPLRGSGGGATVAIRCFGAFAVLLVLLPVCAPLITPADPNTGDVLSVLQPPSSQHWLGTDASGRDLFSRLVYGSRTALLGPLVVVLTATSVGTALGVLAAWNRGWVDSLIGRLFDLVFSFPSMLLALLFVTVMSPGLFSAALAVSIAFVPAIGRLVRSTALREVNEPYVQALYTQGFGPVRLCVRHVLPNLWPVIVAQVTMSFGYAMVELAGISFLGLGVQDPTADWGAMINTGQGSIVRGFPQESLYSGIVLVLAVVCFLSLGDLLSERRDGGRR